jgi:hypothetical protein
MEGKKDIGDLSEYMLEHSKPMQDALNEMVMRELLTPQQKKAITEYLDATRMKKLRRASQRMGPEVPEALKEEAAWDVRAGEERGPGANWSRDMLPMQFFTPPEGAGMSLVEAIKNIALSAYTAVQVNIDGKDIPAQVQTETSQGQPGTYTPWGGAWHGGN